MAKIPAGRLRASSVGKLIARRAGLEIAAPIVRAMLRASGTPFPIECPHCGRMVAVLVYRTRRLYGLSGDYIGPALGSGHRDRVTITCGGCKVRWDTSGSGVARAIRNDRPPLVLGYAYWALAIC